ncbi:MAG TPA: TolC family outer membrane protein [Rhodanobacteraceae bacterium]|jgi:outer membrane protein|nr:TolC family outer membrane protein [Rhodanobacteraceae bacterium]
MRIDPRPIRLACAMLLFAGAAHAMDFSDAVRKAQSYDPVTQAAQYAYQAGLEKGKQGTAMYLPQINATGNYNHLHLDSLAYLPPGFPSSVLVGNSSGTLHGFSVTLTQPIYNASAWAAKAELHDQARLAAIQFQGAQQNLILRVAQAYFGVLMAEDNLELTREQKAATAQQLASAKARFKAGKTNITDVDDAQASYDGIVAQEIAAANNLTIQQDQFRSIVGEPPQALASVPDSFTPGPPVPDDLQTWINSGQQGNPNIAGARIQVDISNSEVNKYSLHGRPQLDLFASYQDMRQSGTLPILVAPDRSRQTIVGLQLTVPLFAGGAYQSKYREALAERQQAQYQLQSAVLDTNVQIKQQFLNVDVGVQQIAALQQAVVSARSSLDSTTLGQKVGVRTTLDVLQAQQQYFSALQNLDAARYQYLLSTLNLESLAGTLDFEDVQVVNRYLTEDPH